MAAVFLVTLFLFKTPSVLKNLTEEGASLNQGLSYGGNFRVGDLVSVDTDQDGVLDWEESLWGTDPTKKDTDDDGTMDGVEVENLKAAENKNSQVVPDPNETVTKTDEFSQELFATIAALNQSGAIDQGAIDKLSASLADQVQASSPEKIYTFFDIKIINDNSIAAVKNYNNAMGLVIKEYKGLDGVAGVLEEFVSGGDNADASTLLKLDPIIKNINETMEGMIKIGTPQQLAQMHLDVINALERVAENLNGMKAYESDTIVSMSAVNQYINNSALLETATFKLQAAIWKGLGN